MLDELAELVSGRDSAEEEVCRWELVRAIDGFLAGLPALKRRMFVLRYWYFEGVAEIAGRLGMRPNHVSVTLGRTRAKLREYLLKRGFDV